MAPTAKPSWENTLLRLQRMVSGRQMSDSLMANSQERVLRYREHLEHAAVRSKYRSSSFREPDGSATNDPQRKRPSYRALILTQDGRVAGTKKLVGENDEEALRAVAAIADNHAVDLWDGLRFIEHFEPKAVTVLQRS